MSKSIHCHFCGGDAQSYSYEHEVYIYGEKSHRFAGVDIEERWGVECHDCDIVLSGFQNEQEAIKAWNASVERTCDGCEHELNQEFTSHYRYIACQICSRNYNDNYQAKMEGDEQCTS